MGMIFRKAPVLLLGGKSPERFREDVDLLGTSFEGCAKSVVEETIVMGRCGTLVDFDGEGEQRAYLAFYKAEGYFELASGTGKRAVGADVAGAAGVCV